MNEDHVRRIRQVAATMRFGGRWVAWLVATFVFGGVLFVLLSALGARSSVPELALREAIWFLPLYVLYWGMFCFVPYAVLLLAWASLDRRGHNLERSTGQMARGLLYLAAPMVFLGWLSEGLWGGLVMGFFQWLALLLPRLVFPFLRTGAFRTTGVANPFVDAASADLDRFD